MLALEDTGYIFVADAGHGWLGVPRRQLDDLRIASQITEYSYYNKRADTVWLEEDCDAALFARAYEERTGKPITYVYHDDGDWSSIRNLPRYMGE